MITKVNNKQEAIDNGFAGFNSGQHVLVDGTQFESMFPTVSIKFKEGCYVTVSLLPADYTEGADQKWDSLKYRGVDVAMHSGGKVQMNCSVMGAGPTYYSSFQGKDAPTVIAMFPKK